MRTQKTSFSSLIELFQTQVQEIPDFKACTFLVDGESTEEVLTLSVLDQKAKKIAAFLQQSGLQNERVLLLYPPGIDYILAFFGCLYAGALAVPAYPPDPSRLARTLPRLEAILKDCGAKAILTIQSIQEIAKPTLGENPAFKGLAWIATDTLDQVSIQDWSPPLLSLESLAFLQYTSGSTGTPKGVMLSHGNLLHNLKAIRKAFEIKPQERSVLWLPPYHDMGLIGGILGALYAESPLILMSPLTFLQRPIRWLQAISRYRGVLGGGPNFAYDLCARKAKPEEIAALDLSSWKVAFNGAEPIRAETLERFAKVFKPAGFNPEAFYPCYGLAEGTLIVTGSRRGKGAHLERFSPEKLKEHQVSPFDSPNSVRLASSGFPVADQEIRIVDPETRTPLPEEKIGEIWISGPSVAQGYWNRLQETRETLQAELSGEQGKCFLRTGDLGFLRGGELFVTGRLKDLILIRGQNHYPQDLELTVEVSHPLFRPGCGAAFSIEKEGEEVLVILQECEDSIATLSNPESKELFGTVRSTIAEKHGLDPFAILLLRKGEIPKTSSGKISRRNARESFLKGEFEPIAQWKTKKPFLKQTPGSPPSPENKSQEVQKEISELENWLCSQISERTGVPFEKIKIDEPFSSYGLDSKETVGLSGDLQDWLGRPLSPTLLWEYPTIEKLAASLSRLQTQESSEHARQHSSLSSNPKTPSHSLCEPIAIIGMGCRFPGGNSPEEFWRLLEEGKEAVSEVPTDRFRIEDFYGADPATPGKMHTRWGGFLKSIDQFDPLFFGISPREAQWMDPQQRLLLEVSWEALENAGIPARRLKGTSTGVFIGIGSQEYAQEASVHQIEAYSGPGKACSIAANRLSYFYDLRGPSLAVDTACSSSLVAIHLACQSLQRHEISLAIAGGANILLSPKTTIAFSQARMLSPTGHCKTFDADADGYVRGEGAGVVLLKRLSDALRDQDEILAVIRGSAINQDGKSNGLTAPNKLAQEEVIRAALEEARISPAHLSYIEAHGTGTPLGDPIEVEALGNALRKSSKEACYLSSVKTNIGHLECAAGIAGLIKVVLMLKHQKIPAHLHLKRLNEKIAQQSYSFQIPTQTLDWQPSHSSRIAGINSFGFGGTNCHLILEEASFPREEKIARPVQLVKLSAPGADSFKTLAAEYTQFLRGHPSIAPEDFSLSANRGKEDFEFRKALVFDSISELQSKLESLQAPESKSPKALQIAFLFTGQGSQYPHMAKQLYETEPVFQKIVEECGALARPFLEVPLLEVLYPKPGREDLIHQTAYTQPALFTVEYALAKLLESFGVKPQVVLGHSVGEYVAAVVAGVMSIEDALELICERGKLMQSLPQEGEMLAVLASQEKVEPIILPHASEVSIAAINAPENLVLSGKREAIEKIAAHLEREKIPAQWLKVSHAFHSPLMEPILERFEKKAAGFAFRAPKIALISNLTGKAYSSKPVDAAYWRRHVREAVQFSASVQSAIDSGANLFIEVGPHPTLTALAKKTGLDRFVGLSTLKREESNSRTLLEMLGQLYERGGKIDWEGFHHLHAGKKVWIPNTPYEKQRYWITPSSSVETLSSSFHSFLGKTTHASFQELLFEIALDLRSASWLADHQVQGSVILPGAYYLVLALEGGKKILGTEKIRLEDCSFKRPLFLNSKSPANLEALFALESKTEASARFSTPNPESASQKKERIHATGKVVKKSPEEKLESLNLELIRDNLLETIEGTDYYLRLRQAGLEYGPAFQGVEKIFRKPGEALGKIVLSSEQSQELQRSACALDAAFHVLGATLDPEGKSSVYLPTHLQSLSLSSPFPSEFWVHAFLKKTPEDIAHNLCGDLFFYDHEGGKIGSLQALTVSPLEEALPAQIQKRAQERVFETEWTPASEPIRRRASVSDSAPVVLFTAKGEDAQRLGSELERQEKKIIRVFAGETFREISESEYALCVESKEDFARLFSHLTAKLACTSLRVVYAWGLKTLDPSTVFDPAEEKRLCEGLLYLLQTLVDLPSSSLVIATQKVAARIGPSLGSALWGFARTSRLEHPELSCRLVDLSSPEDVPALAKEVLSASLEPEIALRGSQRLVPRLVKSKIFDSPPPPKVESVGQDPFRLEITTPGTLDSFHFVKTSPASIPANGIEIQVQAAGLNFSDVMKILGLYPGIRENPVPLGIECSGVVSRVGAGVQDFRVGDEVIAIAPFSFGRFAVTSPLLTVKKPRHLSFEEGAALPITYLTAFYALHDLGRMRRKESLLIHAAAGGVGLAAIDLAKAAGVEIFATAGSPEKRAYLETLGVQHIFDSRTLRFAEEVLEKTRGKGVDLVLNSLSGEFIPASLSLLKEYGRFLEIGKTDIYQNSKLPLKPFSNCLSYFAIDLDRLIRDRPEQIQQMFADLMKLFEERKLNPLPLKAFPIGEIQQAFRYMAQRKNIGKVVIQIGPAPVSVEISRQEKQQLSLDNASTYLITGGLGGLGLKLAEWLAEKGARHLALVSRRAPSTIAQKTLEKLKTRGIDVQIFPKDAAEAQEFASVFEKIHQSGFPLRGIFHAAGVLEDGFLLNQTAEQWGAVMRPKIQAAWNLHQQSLKDPLDFFVLFSSIASVLGSPGQANYAAANAALEGIAQMRRERKLPTLIIQWGPWGEVGMAARAQTAKHSVQSGIGILQPQEALQVLEQILLASKKVESSSTVAALQADWKQVAQTFFPNQRENLLSPLLDQKAESTPSALPNEHKPSALDREALIALKPEERPPLLISQIRNQVARVMGIDSNKLDPNQSLNRLGLDSLMAIEMKNEVEARLKVKLPMVSLLKGPTIIQLADELLKQLETASS